MPWYTTGLTPGSLKNTIAGADSTPNLLLIIRTKVIYYFHKILCSTTVLKMDMKIKLLNTGRVEAKF